ncbi:hypothetical protein [Limnohabitans sp.]|uniref:hypothetical protein n=1 Tax=Limnohabitans sp. TaxID=1907725 RepID=UPI00286EC1C7|nr:hypothetical protein [Limnohabitans sp.]
MTALTADRDTQRRENLLRSLPVKGATKIFAGSLVAVDTTGNAVRGATSTTLKAVGRAEEQVDNTAGADGAQRITVSTGIFRFANSAAADLITLAAIDGVCYMVDDQTVALTNATNTRVQAGIVRDVDAGGVWVEVGMAR